MTKNQKLVLQVIKDAVSAYGQVPPATEIARRTNLHLGSVVAAVQALEKDNLLERTNSHFHSVDEYI